MSARRHWPPLPGPRGPNAAWRSPVRPKGGGNKNLQPEKSKQATLGLRFEPSPALSIGADWWYVGIKDLIGQIPEGAAFADPAKFSSSWSSNKDVATGTNFLAFLADNKNLGKYFASGVDLDISSRMKTGIGDLKSQFTLTYMLREDQQIEKNAPTTRPSGSTARIWSWSRSATRAAGPPP